jgi:LPXTG-site transpeptidase (sortase) family protein
MRASTFLIGLGLVLAVAMVASIQAESQSYRSPLDQTADSGQANKGLAPIAVPKPQEDWMDGAPVDGQHSAAATRIAALIPDRIVIPAIKLDAPIRQATLNEIEFQGKTFNQWVAPSSFAAGQIATSAPLGAVGNTVLIGHHNVYGEVFGHLVDLNVGDQITVYSGDQKFLYGITQKLILRELGEPLEIRLQNAQWIGPTQDERLTLVTCWPHDSNTHRLIIVAMRLSNGGP